MFMLFYWRNFATLWYSESRILKCPKNIVGPLYNEILPIGFRNIKAEYRLNHQEIKEVIEKCNLGVNSNYTFKADNRILFMASKEKKEMGG